MRQSLFEKVAGHIKFEPGLCMLYGMGIAAIGMIPLVIGLDRLDPSGSVWVLLFYSIVMCAGALTAAAGVILWLLSFDSSENLRRIGSRRYDQH